MAKGFTDKNGKFRPTGNERVSNRTKKLQPEGMRDPKSTIVMQHDVVPQPSFGEMEEELKDYFKSFDWFIVKDQVDKADEIKLGDFDPDSFFDGEGSENKRVKVEYIGTQQSIYSDQLAGVTGEVKDEIFNDYFLFGKGDDFVKEKLGDDYSLYVREEDIFFVKGI